MRTITTRLSLRLLPPSLAAALALVAALLAVRFSPPVAATTSVGGPLSGLTSTETKQFNTGNQMFTLNWSVRLFDGLGPVFTQAACQTCHTSPVKGGGSRATNTLFGTLNPDGSFNPLTNEGGPLLHPQSISQFTTSCALSGEVLPGDATIVSLRHVPMLFGDGLIDAIPDGTIEGNASIEANDPTDQMLGIHGVANMTAGPDGNLHPGRFGFKAFRPTLVQLVADAFQHDLGITNPIDPNEDLPQGNPIPAGCQLSKTSPNDHDGSETIHIFQFVEFLAPNPPPTLSPGSPAQLGEQVFQSIGCVNCHMTSMTTPNNVQVATALSSSGQIGTTETVAALSNQTANLYSDLLLHNMGSGLADGVPQGQASGSQWRTTPLWGLSLRTVFIHDGRATNLTTAILDHSSSGSEANAVITNFQNLSSTDQSNLLAFLNSL